MLAQPSPPVLNAPRVRLGIRARIGLLVLGIVAGLGMVYVFLAQRTSDENARQILDYRVQVAASFSRHLDEVFLRVYDRLLDIADDHGRDLALVAGGAALPSYQIRLRQDELADIAVLIGRDGRVKQADRDHPELVGFDLSAADYVKRGFSGGEPHMLPAVDPVTGGAALAVVAPVKSDGEIMALLVGYARLSSDHIVNDLLSIVPGKTGYVDLIDENATVVASSKVTHVGKPSDHADTLRMNARPHSATIGIMPDEGNRQRRDVVAMTSLSVVPWCVVIEQDEEEALAHSQIVENSLILIGLGALASIIILGWFITWYISLPIKALTEAASRLGESDLSTPIDTKGFAEIGSLALTLEQMRVNILQLLASSQRSYRSSIRLLGTVIDARDRYTATHSTDVSSVAGKIAKQMGLAEEDVDVIETASLVHDIGKIGVDDAVLGKVGPLTPIEQVVMTAHPSIGAAILGQMEDLQALVPLVKHHHEWYDGRGYPDGLAGDDIPLGARILSVADAFSAMTSDRSYRRALSMAEAVSRLDAGRGSQFDPAAVDALLAVLATEDLQYSDSAVVIAPEITASVQ